MKRPPRKPSHLSESLHQRLNAYTLAASAAGVGLLAVAQPAEGKIVYTPAHNSSTCNVRSSGRTIDLNLNDNGKHDFRLVNNAISYYIGGCNLSIFAVDGRNQIMGSTAQAVRYASALSAGALIGPNSKFRPWHGGQLLVGNYSRNDSGSHYRTLGQWKNVTGRFLGLKFYIGKQVHYGWARLRVTVPSHHQVDAVLTGFAYETVPNQPIIAGKTKGPDVTVQTSTLGHLARGAAPIPRSLNQH
jgi:hypothetical protein